MILRQKIKCVSVAALKRKIDLNPSILTSWLTAREIRYCKSKRNFAEPAAARIAAKQAALSLFKIPVRDFSGWRLQIEVCKKKSGQSFLKLSAKLKKKIALSNSQSLMLSLAHERTDAIAWVVLRA